MATRKRRLSNLLKSVPIIRLRKFGQSPRPTISQRYKKTLFFARKKPFTSFFVSLGALLLIIILGSTIFRTVPPKVIERSESKKVTVYKLNDIPSVSVQGEIKKGGVVTMIAQTPGIVSQVNKFEGEIVNKDEVIINLSSNYQGGNAATLQRQLAGVTFQNTKNTYEIQKGLISKQRDLANQQAANSEEMRKLTEISINETRSFINLNSEILNSIKSNLQNLIDNNGDPAQIQALQQAQAQMQAGQNQLQAGLRASEYSVNVDKPPVNLEQIGKEIALAQIDIQEKALKMGLQAAGIQLKLAQVMEANMYPASPFTGTIEKIHVKVGDSITPGMPLVTISGGEGNIVIDAQVPKEIASKVSKIDMSTIEVGDKKIEVVPIHVSSEATSGQLYSVTFVLDQIYQSNFTDKSYVKVILPIGQSLVGSAILVPIDSVFQTQEGATVFVAQNKKAVSKKVSLGEVSGGFVLVKSGLNLKDQVILTRNVVNGDPITVQN